MEINPKTIELLFKDGLEIKGNIFNKKIVKKVLANHNFGHHFDNIVKKGETKIRLLIQEKNPIIKDKDLQDNIATITFGEGLNKLSFNVIHLDLENRKPTQAKVNFEKNKNLLDSFVQNVKNKKLDFKNDDSQSFYELKYM